MKFGGFELTKAISAEAPPPKLRSVVGADGAIDQVKLGGGLYSLGFSATDYSASWVAT